MYVKDIPSTHLDLEKNWNNIMYSYTCPYACTTCGKKNPQTFNHFFRVWTN